MGFLATIVVGGLIGWVSTIITKTSNQLGCLWNIFLGIAGAALGHWAAEKYFHFNVEKGFNWEYFGVGVGGAIALIIALRFIGIIRNK
ncbi:MAG: GlsB/YeaQ/YmgE family stress response membrane protein [Chlorobiota bacterium]|jgi:uncharacterized membrane protein YeaQ/YmgE (transglycosylase-associated protein family)|nr:GlsB/YeaQ/YmgE family stress response membrane protein [Chlorobiota bacterium]QQS66503.1 MAG: GlsB/YeaQ/YmgE family stress response membrane protein [Chlorobiota bacterium]